MILKKSFFRILQGLVVLVGIAILGLLLWEPHLEGRNAHASWVQIYGHDPFLAYVYVGSISFFVGLYYLFKAVGYWGDHQVEGWQIALKRIRYCALTLMAFIAGAEAYFFLVQRGKVDDIAGGVMMGFFLMGISSLVVFGVSLLRHNRQLPFADNLPVVNENIHVNPTGPVGPYDAAR
ncbi:MAG: DUF2975 domain-containing protein [Candidatus Margulisiibacteriota bacterium]